MKVYRISYKNTIKITDTFPILHEHPMLWLHIRLSTYDLYSVKGTTYFFNFYILQISSELCSSYFFVELFQLVFTENRVKQLVYNFNIFCKLIYVYLIRQQMIVKNLFTTHFTNLFWLLILTPSFLSPIYFFFYGNRLSTLIYFGSANYVWYVNYSPRLWRMLNTTPSSLNSSLLLNFLPAKIHVTDL